jgi:hypothetical protein
VELSEQPFVTLRVSKAESRRVPDTPTAETTRCSQQFPGVVPAPPNVEERRSGAVRAPINHATGRKKIPGLSSPPPGGAGRRLRERTPAVAESGLPMSGTWQTARAPFAKVEDDGNAKRTRAVWAAASCVRSLRWHATPALYHPRFHYRQPGLCSQLRDMSECSHAGCPALFALKA